MSDDDRLMLLLVDDNPGDIVFFHEALEAAGAAAKMHVTGDGLEAMMFLRKEGRFADTPRPDIMVLDLNLPRKTGQEVLRELAADASLSRIPVAVLTTSAFESHVVEGYPQDRCRYFVKSGDFRALVQIVRQITAFAQEHRPPQTQG
jgi:CheY-like chemotaxis protein